MSENGNRGHYDRVFKVEAVGLIVEDGRTATEVACHPGIHVNLIYLWKKQLAEDSEEAFPGLGKLRASDAELRRL